MPAILITIAVLLLVLWLLAHLIGALLHLLFWLVTAAPYIAIALIIAAFLIGRFGRKPPTDPML